jgi:MoxR-like ATPase
MNEHYHIKQEQGDGAAASYNVRFEGNPGSGKTTIARHYATFLKELKVRLNYVVVQCLAFGL